MVDLIPWIVIACGALLGLLVLMFVLKLAGRRRKRGLGRVDFTHYKGQEYQRRGQYHDIVK